VLFRCYLQLLKEYLERALDMVVDTTTTDAGFPGEAGRVAPVGASSSAQDITEITSSTGESSPMGNSGSGAHNAFATGAASATTPVPTTPAVGFTALEGTKMSLLLQPPAIPLNMEATCMALNERIVAAESCCFISMVRESVCGVNCRILNWY
jgi:hypothetical protein